MAAHTGRVHGGGGSTLLPCSIRPQRQRNIRGPTWHCDGPRTVAPLIRGFLCLTRGPTSNARSNIYSLSSRAPCVIDLYPHRLFRTLAGLDDPAEEAPSVIVSRYAGQRSTRNLGGTGESGRSSVRGGDAGRRLTVAFGRASSVVGSVSRRDDADYSSDSSSDSFSDNDDGNGRGRRRGRGFSGHSFAESGSATNVIGFGDGSGKKKSGRFSSNAPRGGGGSGPVIPAPSGRTWAAFSRDCARREDAPTLNITDELHDFRSSSGRNRRSSSRERRCNSRGSSADGTVAPGFEGCGGGAGVPDSPESSTVSGLTGWRRQRLQQRLVSQRSSRRAARDSGAAQASAAADGAGESKHGDECEDYGRRSRRRGGTSATTATATVTGTATTRAAAAKTAKVSARSWNKAGAPEGGSTGGAGGARTRTATSTGMKDLSALSRPSTTESRKSAATKNDERRTAAVTGTSAGLSASGRSGSGGGGASLSGSGSSSRPGTSLKDTLKARRGSGGGSGGGDGRRRW